MGDASALVLLRQHNRYDGRRKRPRPAETAQQYDGRRKRPRPAETAQQYDGRRKRPRPAETAQQYDGRRKRPRPAETAQQYDGRRKRPHPTSTPPPPLRVNTLVSPNHDIFHFRRDRLRDSFFAAAW